MFLVCTWPNSLVFPTSLDTPVSSPFSTPFLTRAPSPTTPLSLLYLSASPATATLQGGSCCARLAEQSPLTRRDPPRLQPCERCALFQALSSCGLLQCLLIANAASLVGLANCCRPRSGGQDTISRILGVCLVSVCSLIAGRSPSSASPIL